MTCLRAVGVCLIGLLSVLSVAEDALAASAVAEAVKKSDKAALRALLQKRVDVNAPDPDGTTALHWAAYNDDLETANVLIRAGANAKAANRYGVSPLALASTNGNAAMLQALLKAGADPNAGTPEGETPLMLAARSGIAPAVRVLVTRSADVNAVETWRGQTALMWAAVEGHVDVINTLIDAGADIHARSKGGLTPLLFAVREGNVQAVKALLARGGNVNDSMLGGSGGPAAVGVAPPEKGPSALLLGVSNAHFELATMLLEAGADPNSAPQGWTSLHELSWVRKPGLGDNPPAPPGSGNVDSIEMVKRLAARGADLNSRASGRLKILTYLNLNGGTPFFFASRTCDIELMRLLVSLGADPLIANEDGTTPLIAAAGLNTRSTGEDPGTEAECLEAVKLTLELGNDINAVDNKGETAMHGAAYKQMPSVVKYLSENGAKSEVWNTKNSNGWTPLRLAVGVFRGTVLRSHVPTTKAIQEALAAAGLSTELEAGPSAISAK